ncbi:hypothetical protein [Burkholderia gladioli]|uniref:hypothetical protein n=1 Tax=Burkholderia gladioli TaxID=28095 RepID=UPI000D00E44C|nr:hypothetical protein [Burkholderia gladioli]
MTNTRNFDKQRVAMDLMDAYVQLLLAITWQNRRTDGLEKLIRLGHIVNEKIYGRPDLFPSEVERLEASSGTLQALQRMRHRERGTAHPWTTSPVDCDLKRWHTVAAAQLLVEIATLVNATQLHIQSNTPRQELIPWIHEGLAFLSRALSIPLHTIALTDLILRLASQPGQPRKAALTAELSSYRVFSERAANDPRLRFHLDMMAELKPQADDIQLEIDASYNWADLSYLAKETSLKAISIYGLLNKYKWLEDGHFSEAKRSDREIPVDIQERFLTHQQLHGMSLMMSGSNRETRRLQHHIVNSRSREVTVEGHRLSNSLVIIIPYQDNDIDLEYLMGQALVSYSRIRRAQKHRDATSGALPSEYVAPSSPLLEEIPKALWGLVEGYGLRRKVTPTKKDLLFCLAGLMAENIYHARARNKPKLKDGSPVKTLEDSYSLTIELLASHGFTYSATTLRKGRTRFRKEYLEKIPEILNLYATAETGRV